ncbi:DUF72 domain-containing protein [Truepera radiovictrix]|uniref:DUF72 domain-containing protein n=1 Tax=Truepera radiovictrix (strain DSM 17093 / CIP 108686 / LMG 22925 / RQ-24) TaxID=649638 RepID=D7CU65_TRURR|nr:DUF72 domain-containing protein [Truepera radiovictrix]ADI13963.1 protein of unknown function DUF72 [Truepera radiovictrix DSM 17093]WMT57473.1 DUF72 domain-containing protein [Truepera radiovictrix]
MELYLGTGGYSNDDWVGLFYPEGTKPGDYLAHYAAHFNAVELNSSFYNIPGTKAFAGMLKKSEARLRFAVKLHQSMTHTRDADAELYGRLFESVAPLREAGMLGPFLAQFPYSFHRTPENRRYLKGLTDRFAEAGEALAVEFRTAEWHVPEVYEAFARAGLIAVSVDYPQLPKLPPPELLVTSSTAYIRLHGRNEDTWYGGKSAAERHDYRYTPDELRPWVSAVVAQAERLEQVYVFFQNTTKGHALKNLAMLKELFAEHDVDAPISL